MNVILRLGVLTSICFVLCSCEKVLFDEDLASNDPHVNFDHLWREVDEKYSYFTLKGIDWDAIYDQYKMQINSDMPNETLFDIMAQMLNELRDDHVNLISPFDVSRYDVALRNPPNYLERTVEEHYLFSPRITGPFTNAIIPGTDVGYIRYESFSNQVSRSQLDYVLLRLRETRGIILDLRENGGGSLSNVSAILEHFTDQRKLVAYSITRNGPGRDEFSDPRPVYINPTDGVRYLKPVVVLTDRGSYSATTFFALAAKALPNITLLGDTTGGGGGLPNGGQLPNGWRYRFSITQLLDLDLQNFAESGVPPHITAAFDWNDLNRDEIIDAAVAWLVQ